MSTPAATTGNDSPKLRDDTTRFLCGAAHRDEEFADSAIREYLVEATRSIPRSPGVNAGVVLREAVAARSRRKVRDAVLPVPAVVVLFAANGTLLAPWLLVAVTVAVATNARTAAGGKARSALPPHVRGPLALGSIASAIALFFVLYKFTDELDDASTCNRYYYEEYEPESSGAGLGVTIIAISLVFAVPPADRVITWLLVTMSFRRSHFRTSAGEEELWRGEWTLRRLGHSNYEEALAPHPVEENDEPEDPDAAQVDNYFQLTDVERYIKALESRLLRTMGEFLESKGISVTGFMEQAMQVTNNNAHITGPVISSNIATAGKARTGNTTTGTAKGRS